MRVGWGVRKAVPVIEILILFLLWRRLGKILRGKGRQPLGYQVLAVAFWIFGGFAAAVAYGAYLVSINPRLDPAVDVPATTLYVVVLIGSGLGGAFALLMALVLAPLNQPSFTNWDT